MNRARCPWAGDDPLMQAYHDREWGVPLHDDRALFELLTLEGAQAGLSWRTVLHRRQGYREVFDNFDLERIAAYTPADIEARRADPASSATAPRSSPRSATPGRPCAPSTNSARSTRSSGHSSTLARNATPSAPWTTSPPKPTFPAP